MPGTGPVTNPFATAVIGLLEVGPGSNPPAEPDPTVNRVAGVWGYVGLAGGAPTQTSQPPISCGVYGDGEAVTKGGSSTPGVVGESGFNGTMQDSDPNGDGVMGFGGGNGVRGLSTDGTGVSGTSTNGAGVTGNSTGGRGIAGTSNSAAGVFGSSSGSDGIQGESQSSQHAGVSCINTAGGYGVYAQSVNQSVKGSPAGTAGIFLGNVEIQGDITAVNNIQGNVTVTGTMTALVDVVLGSDCAEDFDIVPDAEINPGTVMVMTDSGALEPSRNAYDRKVAGVISGAGDYRPGLILGRCESSQERMPVALVGKVYCKVDADPAPIAVGDLLTTSARPGFGMKATDSAQAFGAVIGKALKPLRFGQGLIPILVALQ
jgi:hypothetical protein